MSDRATNLAYLSDFCIKWGFWIGYIIIGLMGRLGLDIHTNKKISKTYLYSTTLMAGCVGFISSMWFMKHNPELGACVVPLLTLASRDILMQIKFIDWFKVFSLILKRNGNDADIKKGSDNEK
jgi:hypothetical protein